VSPLEWCCQHSSIKGIDPNKNSAIGTQCAPDRVAFALRGIADAATMI